MADSKYSDVERPAQPLAALQHDHKQFTTCRQAMLRHFRWGLENGLPFDDADEEIKSTISAMRQILALARRG